MIYIRLFHGRTDPNQEMNKWGTDGPVFGPYKFAHTTYASDVKLGKQGEDCDELHICEGMVFYDGVYYGDWSVFDAKVFEKGSFRATVFEQHKTNPSNSAAKSNKAI